MRSSSGSYRKVFAVYLKPQWRRVLLLATLLLSGVALQLVNPQLLRYFIDTAVGGGSQASLLLVGGLFIGIALLNQGSTVLATYVSENIAWRTTNRLRTDLVAHCLTLEMAFHKVHTSGELIERIDGDVDTLSNFFSLFVVNLLSSALFIVGVLVLLFREDWRVGLTMTAFALIVLLVLIRIRNYAVPHWVAVRQKSADFYGFLGEHLAGTEDIRANGATQYVMRRFYQILRGWLPSEIKAGLASYTLGTTTQMLFAIGSALALALGGYLWSRGIFTIGTVYLTFYYTTLLAEPIEQIRNQVQDFQKAGASIQRVQQLLATQPAIRDGVGTALPEGALAVDFREVSFAYNADDWVLRALSFHLEPGKVLGLLGRTGSGKTTLARLLLRLYDVQEGEVSVGGVPVQTALLHDLRRHIGMVTQDVQLFHASVRDNLTFFNPGISDKRILEALDDLGLLAWCQALPQGLDTELGSDGEGLSAGEAQLLAFTRVFLADPGLVILDEASSRLDRATEQLIEQAMDKLLKDRTGMIIAHRLATVRRVDEVMVLQDGCLLEHGDREALAADAGSRFYRLLQTGLEEVYA